VIAATVLAALALDWIAGEPQRWHPLAGFGHIVTWMETRLYARNRWHGTLAVVLLIAPISALAAEAAAGVGVAYVLLVKIIPFVGSLPALLQGRSSV
jgi:adenosylcobinamide-phosphate synthase